jgi:phosphoribosylanthranilate isomerase
VVTDVASDGMLSGPNLDLLRAVCDRTGSPVVASGGISSLTDIADLAALVPEGVEGAIIGTALYVGSFTLQEALVAARGISPVISDTPPAVDRVSTGAEGARA